MTVRKSTLITELDGAVLLQSTNKLGATMQRTAEASAKAAGESSGDIYPVLRAWTGWVPDALVLQSQAWGASGVVEIGAYEVAAAGGAVIVAAAFGSAIDVSAALAPINLLMEAAGQTPDKVDNTIRDMLGIAATVAHRWVDICLTATNIGASQAAKFSLRLHYVEH